jgi:hypothetical protein
VTTIGQLVDQLGVIGDPPQEGDLIESAVVLLKSVDAEGQAALFIATSPRMDWITQVGIIEAARTIIQADTAS